MPKLEALLGTQHHEGYERSREWLTRIGDHTVETAVEIGPAPCSFQYWQSVPRIEPWTGYGTMSIAAAWGVGYGPMLWTAFSEEQCSRQVDVLCGVINAFLDARPWAP
jgi:hypothetical protein